MNQEDVAAFFETLDEDQKRIVSTWRERRVILLQKLRNKTAEKCFQDSEFPTRESKPVLKLKVKCPTNNRVEAILTFWGVTDDQLGILEEGRLIRLRSVNVKDKLEHSIMQLSTSIRTRIIPLSFNFKKDMVLSGYTERSLLPFCKVQLLSMRSKFSSDINFIGCYVKNTSNVLPSQTTVKIYFVDESGLIIRLERVVTDDKILSHWKLLQKSNVMGVFTINDATLMPFDYSEGCSVVHWTNYSSLSNNCNQREAGLKKWAFSNKPLFEDLQNTVGTPLSQTSVVPSSLFHTFGYIRSVLKFKNYNNQLYVKLLIDSNSMARKVDCNVELFQEILSSLGVDNESGCAMLFERFSLDSDDENNLKILDELSYKVSTIGTLLQISLQKLRSDQDERLVVLKARRAPIKTLCSMMVTRTLQGNDNCT